MCYEKYMNCIPQGAINAVSAEYLTTLWECKSDREARKIREELRLAGFIIIADEHGIYQPSEDEEAAQKEIRDYVHRMNARIRTESRSLKPCRDALKNPENDGQLSLSDYMEI